MYCRKCGKHINDNSILCEYCGEQFEEFKESIVKEDAQAVQILSAEISDTVYNDSMMPSENVDYKKIPMKWFNFLVKFLLPVLLILGIIADIINLSKSFEIYSDIFSLFSVKLYFILSLSYIIPSRIIHLLAYINLKDYKKSGYKLFLALIVLYGIGKLLAYIFVMPLVIELVLFDVIRQELVTRTFSTLIVTPIIFILNYIYFKKRKHLFR